MKRIKLFEDFEIYNSKEQPKFAIGDTVICVEYDGYSLNDNEKYIINNIYKSPGTGDYFCTVEGKLREDGNFRPYFCTRFMPESEYMANKFNI